jgi:hypothetical protein
VINELVGTGTSKPMAKKALASQWHLLFRD